MGPVKTPSPSEGAATRPSGGAGGSAPRQVGDPDGHGRYGVLDEDEEGLLCHECGWRGAHLGLHVYKAHGVTARAYRLEHGLRRSKGLVAAPVRENLLERSAGGAWMADRARFLANRDPAKATAARLASGQPALSPAGAAASAAAARGRGGSRRAGIVVVCRECGVEFCPLQNAWKRRFCSRSHASRYNRRAAAQRAAERARAPQ